MATAPDPGWVVHSRAEASVAQLVAESALPMTEARLLIAHVTGWPRVSLISHPERALAPPAQSQFAHLAARRHAGEPMAYLLGQREFFGRPFKVSSAVLIPRPDTELLVECALTLLKIGCPTVLDLGTGSGAIAITLALECPHASVTATDVSDAALAIAKENAATLGAATVRFLAGSWFGALTDERFEVIVSNPPYIHATDAHLEQGDLRFEPRQALTDGGDGLCALRAIVAGAAAHLNPAGWLLVEHGYDQAEQVRALFAAGPWQPPSSWRDLAGIERVTGACLASPA